MALTKETVVDQITVTENGIVLYREATRIMEDGNQLSQTYHRSSLTPAQDLTGVPANVVAMVSAAVFTTPGVVIPVVPSNVIAMIKLLVVPLQPPPVPLDKPLPLLVSKLYCR